MLTLCQALTGPMWLKSFRAVSVGSNTTDSARQRSLILSEVGEHPICIDHHFVSGGYMSSSHGCGPLCSSWTIGSPCRPQQLPGGLAKANSSHLNGIVSPLLTPRGWHQKHRAYLQGHCPWAHQAGSIVADRPEFVPPPCHSDGLTIFKPPVNLEHCSGTDTTSQGPLTHLHPASQYCNLRQKEELSKQCHALQCCRAAASLNAQLRLHAANGCVWH